MKSVSDPRHIKRVAILQELFAHSFASGVSTQDVSNIVQQFPKIDAHISDAAPEWPIDKIAKIDLSILRLALYELTAEKNQPPKVIVDEAVELAKEFGNDNSAKFVNGVLGTILKKVLQAT